MKDIDGFEREPMTQTPSRMRTSVVGWLAAAVFALALAFGATAVVTALHQRPAETVASARPLTVQASPVAIENSYTVLRSFIGRVEPARETRAAFELAGLVLQVAVEEGAQIEEGAVLAVLDADALTIDLAQLDADRRALQADRDLAEATMTRRDALRDRGFESSQSYDEARFAVDAIKARIVAVEAQRRRLRLDIAKSTLTAPFDAVVTRRMVDEGTVVAAGAPLVVLQETARPEARVGLPARIARSLRAEQTVALTLDGAPVKGTVSAVLPDVDPTTRTVPVIIALPPASPALAGEIVRLIIEDEIEARGAWVPVASLSEATRGLWSLTTVTELTSTTEGGMLSTALVEILHLDGDRAFVRGTLREGTQFVDAGPHRAAPGQRVRLATTEAAE